MHFNGIGHSPSNTNHVTCTGNIAGNRLSRQIFCAIYQKSYFYSQTFFFLVWEKKVLIRSFDLTIDTKRTFYEFIQPRYRQLSVKPHILVKPFFFRIMGGHCCRCCSFQERNDENIFDFIRSLSQLQPVENVGSVTSQASNSLESLGSPSWLSFEGEADNVIENVFIGDETTCFVCLENYNDRQNQPRIMPCGHIVCNQCLTGLAKTLLFTEIKCPQDRQVYKVKRRRRRGM